MYTINSKVDKPDIEYLEKRANQLMKNGITVANVDKLHRKFEDEFTGIYRYIQDTYGIKNPNSSKQIVEYLESLDSPEVYNICYVDGKWTSKEDALSSLSMLGYTVATDILLCRKAKKYADSISAIKDNLGPDGRVHPVVSMSKTNRISYSKPALMSIPKPLLWHIVAPRKPGNIIISADIKNQEPSILINILKAESLLKALEDSRGLYESLFSIPFKAKAKLNILVTGGHKAGVIKNSELALIGNVPKVYYTPYLPAVDSTYYNDEQVSLIDITNVVVAPGSGKPSLPEKVTIETTDGNQYDVDVIWNDFDERKLAKNGIVEITGDIQGLDIRCEGVNRKEFKVAWNAMTYGASLMGVQNICKHIDGKLVYDFFMKLPEFSTYRKKCNALANSGQQTIKTYFGTTMSANESDRARLKRVLLDLPIQGTASDILSMLVKHTDEELASRGLQGKLDIVYTRHDEIIFEVDGGYAEEVGMDAVKALISELVEHRVDDWVPFKIEVTEVEPDELYLNIEELE